MGRSVATHRRAVETVYISPEQDELDSDWGWATFIDNLRGTLQSGFKTLADADQWEGRETQAILKNGHALVCVSEYGGMVAVDLVPHEGSALAEAWAAKSSAKFRKLLHEAFPTASWRSIGRASNGEQFFERVNA